MRQRRTIPARVRDFIPPHCPNPLSRFHRAQHGSGWRFQRRGFRFIRRPPGVVRVFCCVECGRSFRNSTFSIDYWKKRAGLAPRTFLQLVNGQGLRQAARCLGVSPTTVRRLQRRLAGQSMLHDLRVTRLLEIPPNERLGRDGLRTVIAQLGGMAWRDE